VDPVLSSIEAITQRCQQTLAAVAADDDNATDTYFHTLEVSFLAVYTVHFTYLIWTYVWLNTAVILELNLLFCMIQNKTVARV